MNNNTGIIISDYYNLLHLHRTLLEAKFHYPADDQEVQYCPFIAELSNQVVEKLIEYEKMQNNLKRWQEWRKLSGKPVFRDKIVKICAEHRDWAKMDVKKKVQVIKTVMSPFICSEDEMEKILLDVDSLLNNN